MNELSVENCWNFGIPHIQHVSPGPRLPLPMTLTGEPCNVEVPLVAHASPYIGMRTMVVGMVYCWVYLTTLHIWSCLHMPLYMPMSHMFFGANKRGRSEPCSLALLGTRCEDWLQVVITKKKGRNLMGHRDRSKSYGSLCSAPKKIRKPF